MKPFENVERRMSGWNVRFVEEKDHADEVDISEGCGDPKGKARAEMTADRRIREDTAKGDRNDKAEATDRGDLAEVLGTGELIPAQIGNSCQT